MPWSHGVAAITDWVVEGGSYGGGASSVDHDIWLALVDERMDVRACEVCRSVGSVYAGIRGPIWRTAIPSQYLESSPMKTSGNHAADEA
jgi:hypothetical protein